MGALKPSAMQLSRPGGVVVKRKQRGQEGCFRGRGRTSGLDGSGFSSLLSFNNNVVKSLHPLLLVEGTGREWRSERHNRASRPSRTTQLGALHERSTGTLKGGEALWGSSAQADVVPLTQPLPRAPELPICESLQL